MSSPFSQMKSYDTSYNRLKCVLALVILRNKPVNWEIEEYIRFVNCNDVQQKQLNEITQAVKEQIGGTNNGGKQTDQEVNDNKNAIVSDENISEGGQLKWRKRALELENDVESLKQQLCMVELELESAKRNITTNKRRKTKATSETTPSNLTKKQSEKKTSAKKGSKKYQDSDCQVFQKIPGADDEAWRQFDIHQAMSFLQQIKLLIPVESTNSSSSVAVNPESSELLSTSSGVVISQAIIKIIRYMSIKLTALLEVFQTNTSKTNNLKQKYPACINSFGTVLKKLIVFLESPLLSTFEKSEIISTIAMSFASLIKAIHILTTQEIQGLTRENNETEDVNESLKSSSSSEIQDPRDVITNILIHICNEVEPKLKEAVCFVAAKECLRLIIEEFNVKDSATENTNVSSGMLHNEKGFETVNDSMTKNDIQIKSIVCKDTTYYLLWILEEILVNNQGGRLNDDMLSEEAIKNISTLLEESILNNKKTSIHGDAFTKYLYNICEKLWVQMGSVSFIDLLEKII